MAQNSSSSPEDSRASTPSSLSSFEIPMARNDILRASTPSTTYSDNRDTHHLVIVGHVPGYFYNKSETIEENVYKIPGNIIMRFHDKEEALQVFKEKLEAGEVVKTRLIYSRIQLRQSDLSQMRGLTREAIVQDLNKYYAIFVGHIPGIFGKYDDIQSNVINIPGAKLDKFRSYDLARENFVDMLEMGQVFKVIYGIERRVLTEADFPGQF